MVREALIEDLRLDATRREKKGARGKILWDPR